MIEALLFDAAGTLIAPAEPVGDTYARILGRHRIAYGDLQAGFARAFSEAGEPDFPSHVDGDAAERQWWRRVVDQSVGGEVPDEAFTDLFDHYAAGNAWSVLPGVVEALEVAHGFRLAVVSNFDRRLHRVLDELGLAPHFELILTSADARARKPSPVIFEHALQQLGLSPSQVRHVGDSAIADGEGAGNAGIRGYVLGRDIRDLPAFVALARKADARNSL
ncbi:HAD-IA family hydrolase [Haloferula sp. A504]|uniref:HAD-IA family hydrolase n=1 Tax=Haloferula sp. A504 TaxID=3373601 RepID=UPI0031CC039A|nr:HAD-IA family hydrolase [Verrucomicrobiaceae bacterium E54]